MQHSAWKADPEDLKVFLKSARATGGQGNEAIEVGLRHANQQSHLKRIVVPEAQAPLALALPLLHLRLW
jgi:hypothetical protein